MTNSNLEKALFEVLSNHTPESIEHLDPNEIFVFGSNKAGHHAGGAAKLALDKFGAIYGQGEGLQGQTYALPTLDENLQKLSKAELQRSFENFLQVVEENFELDFFLTKVGTGIAGYSIEEVKEVFYKAIKNVGCTANGYGGCPPINLFIPKEFGLKNDESIDDYLSSFNTSNS